MTAPSMVRYVDKKLGDLSQSSVIWSGGAEKVCEFQKVTLN